MERLKRGRGASRLRADHEPGADAKGSRAARMPACSSACVATGEFGRFSETVMGVYSSVKSAFNRANEPGKPLATVANLTREAPLGSLFVAFVLGVAFATRHVNRR